MRTDSATKYALSLAAFVAVLLSPFYIFGADSAIGWYDEVNATIPWTAITSRHANGAFVHEWAGGAGSAQNFLQGTERVSLLGALSRAFTPQAGALLDRCLFMGALLAGVYLSARRLLNATRRSSAIAAAFSAVSMPVNYSWIIAAGSGWLAPFSLWLTLAITDPPGVRRNVSFAMCAAIFTFVGNPAFMLMCVPALLTGAWGLGILGQVRWRQAMPLLALLGVCLLGNYYPGLLDYYDYLQHASSRYQGFHGSVALLPATLPERIVSASHVFDELWSWTVNVVTLAAVLTVTGVTAKFDRRLAATFARGVLGIMLFCLSMEFAAKLWPALPIARLRWSVPLITLSVINAWIVAAALSRADAQPDEPHADVRSFRATGAGIVTAVVVLATAANSLWFLRSTVSDLAASGGWATYRDYALLRELSASDERFRVASGQYTTPRASVAPMHGVHAFDGMAASFPLRRTLFFQRMLQNDPDAPVHTHHQGITPPLTPGVIDSLRMAGVGALLSQDRDNPPAPGLTLVGRTNGRSLWLPFNNETLNSLLGISGGEIKVLPPLSVWRIADPWERIFIAKSIAFSEYGIGQREYWLDLKQIDRHGALFAHGDPGIPDHPHGANSARLQAWSLDDNGFRIVTDRHEALVVINQVFDGYWRAICNGREVPISPVNGIMMALSVPPACTETTVVRKTRFR